jgi:hypothetical protein
MRKFKINKLQLAEVKADFQKGLQSRLEYDSSEDPSPETLGSNEDHHLADSI